MLRKNIYIIILVLLGISLNAQENFILHNFNVVPQNYMTNPAIKSPSRFVIGFPALSSIHAGFNSNSFNLDELLIDDPDSDSLLLDLEGVIGSLKSDMAFDLNLQEELFFLGFRFKKGFISMGIGHQTEANFSLDKEFLELLWYGNADPRFMNTTVDFSGTDFSVISYLQFHLGLSYEINEDWTVGTRIKLLKGLGNIDVERFDGTMLTRPDGVTNYAIEATSNILINTSMMDNMRFFDDDFDDADDMEFMDLLRQQNNGMAFDFGFRYTGFDRFEIAASIIDFGKINWKENVINYATDEVNYTFDGVEYDDINDDSEVFDDLTAELEEQFNFDKSYNSYKTTLATKFYVSGSYEIDKKSQVDALVYGRAIDGRFKSAFSLGINRQFNRTFGLRTTYSIYNQQYFNVGLGMSLNLGPIQTYFLTDNIIAAVAPSQSNMFNFRFGFNVNIRSKKKAKVVIVEEEDDYEEVEY